MPLSTIVAIFEFITQQVQKLNLLLARQRLNVLVVNVFRGLKTLANPSLNSNTSLLASA
jgi:hypothetical protein